MKITKVRISKRTIQLFLLAVLGLLFVYYMFMMTKPLERVSLSGYFACIPTKREGTLGCNKGIVTQKGEYFESHTLMMSTFAPRFEIGDSISARGILRKYSPLQRLIKNSKASGSFAITDSLHIGEE